VKKNFYETNGILAQKNPPVGVIERKIFCADIQLHRDFLALSSVEKITATEKVQ